ncbi:MAG: hypothetical protein ACREQ3_17880 [Candidatus Binatia bacterium]
MKAVRIARFKLAYVVMTLVALVGGGLAGASFASSASDDELLYQADWSDGLNGWEGGKDWKTLNASLLNDGTGPDDAVNPILADFKPSTADYAVEAEIRVALSDDFTELFGFVARVDGKGGGYASGLYDSYGYIWYVNTDSLCCGSTVTDGDYFDLDSEWHTYRVEVKGNEIRSLVDGTVLAEAVDNKYLEGDQVGLWSDEGTQLEVRSFKVFAI